MKKLRQTILYFSLSLLISFPALTFAATVNLETTYTDSYVINLPNGLALTSADIRALAPYFEVNQKTQTTKEIQDNFINAFNSLATSKAGAIKATQLLNLIHAHSSLAKVTLPAVESEDRFGDKAWEAYKIGHELAIKDAITAHQTMDMKRLSMAIAKNNLATQYLVYRFAAGHIRTPRSELPEHSTPRSVGDYLSGYMHDEENKYGIVVHNQRGNHWIAYGEDKKSKSDYQNGILKEAIKISSAEILKTYLTGKKPTNDYLTPMLPYADEIGNASDKDISPLFYWDASAKKVMRRQDMTNVYDKHWTADWWDWSTLAELERERGLKAKAQQEIVAAGLKDEAMQHGIVIDKNIK